MPPSAPDLERPLRIAFRQARMVAFVCGFVAPAMYLLTLGSQVLHGHWEQFLGGFGRLPWGDPRVPRALGAAALALVLALGVVPRLFRPQGPESALGVLRARNLLASALLAAAAVCGLWLGVKIGPPAASLSLALCLAAMAGACAVFPRERRWREALAEGLSR
jgi:hypothetical protein